MWGEGGRGGRGKLVDEHVIISKREREDVGVMGSRLHVHGGRGA